MWNPLHDRVLIKPIDEDKESVTASGIFIPDTAKDQQTEGEVVAHGPGRWHGDRLVELAVTIGDRVLYSKYGGAEVKIDGKELLIINEADILAVESK